MKTIAVVAAIIRDGGRVFATQRGYGDWKDYWEFPGGKIEPGETPEEALIREIREELGAEIAVDSFLHTIKYDYPAFHLSMGCYLARVTAGELTLKEHEAARWLSRDELDSVPWLPADQTIIGLLKQKLLGAEAKERERSMKSTARCGDAAMRYEMLRTRLTNFGFVLMLLLVAGAFALFGKDSSVIIGAASSLALPLLLMIFGRSKLPFYRNVPWILLGMIGAASFCLYGEEVNSNFEVLGRYYYRLIDFVGDSTGNLLMTLVPIIVVVVLRLVSGKHAFPPLTLLRYMALAFFLIVLDEAKLPAPLILGLCVVFGCMFRELTASVYEPKPCLHLAFLLLAILYLVYPPILGYNLTAKLYDAIVSPSLITAGIAVVLGGACILDSNGETDRTHAATRLLEGQHMAMTFFAFAVLDLFFYALPALWSPYVLVLGIPAARMVLEYAGSRMTVERGQAPTARFGKTAAGFGIALAVLPALSRSLTNPDGRYIGRWEFMICLFVLITAWYIVARVVKAESPSDTMHYFWGVASILTLFCVFGLREAALMRILVLVFLIALWVLLNVFLRRPGFQSKDLYKQENHYPLLVMHWSPVALLGLSVIILYFL